MPGDSLRIALFTHDTFGLGHVRRSVRFLRRLSIESPQAALLLVSGSPALGFLENLPPRTDVVKIPTVARTGASNNQPPHLPLPLTEITRIRERVICETILAFAPHVLLVDNFPLGSRGELRRTLEAVRRSGTKTVLGLRDILDASDVVRRDWTRQGTYEVLDHLYDAILVYGMQELFDVTEAYALPETTARKLVYCGYVTETAIAAPSGNRSDPFLLATGGGGGDALPLLNAFVEALSLLPRTMPAILFTGPLMGAADKAALHAKAADLPNLTIKIFDPNLPSLISAAEVVVSMCGYNTTAEILAASARAVMVPRTWRYGEHEKGDAGGREWEQLLRARSLASMGLIDLIEPEALTAEHLARRIVLRSSAPRPNHSVSLDGVNRVTQELLKLATANGHEGRTIA
jgi:predicted glycosyltransferase